MSFENKVALATEWLWSAIQDSSLISAERALIEEADPNFLNPERMEAAIHAAIRIGNLGMVRLLIRGPTTEQPVQLANLNAVTSEFEPCVVVATKRSVQNKIDILREILLNRKMCDRKLLDEYVFICVNALREKKNLIKNDFGLLAHYASRLCGVNIGKIINEKNNDNRYLAHLCQYIGAKIYNEEGNLKIELNGWCAIEFLPIRIFSLFEILVKLETGAICVEDKDNWCEILRDEILIEIQTFKIEQERRSIEIAPGLEDIDRENLYFNLANKFIGNIINNADQEFCLASGYSEHTVYIAFIYEKDKDTLLVRFDNLGAGIVRYDDLGARINRHPIEDDKIYPKIVKIEHVTSKISTIEEYIVRLFLINSKKLPKRYLNDATEEEKKIADLHYKQAREKILAEIYDDTNQLGYIDVSTQRFGMSEQRAGTCVATSHQVGLLSRLKDEKFYEWVLSQEKICIVQASRNEGVLTSTNHEFWKITANDFNVPKYFDFCSRDEMDVFMESQHVINELCEIDGIKNISFYLNLKRIFDADSYNELKSVCQSFEQMNTGNLKIPCGLQSLLWLKLSLKEDGLVDKFQHINKSKKILELALKSEKYIDKPSELYFNYFLGLILYSLNQLDTAQSYFSRCYNLTLRFLKRLEDSPYNLGRHYSNFLPALHKLKNNTEISQGFLYIEQGKYTEAARKFEITSTKTSMRNGMHYIGQTFTCYPEAALFGLGMIKYLEAISNQDINLCGHGLRLASRYLIAIEDKTSPIFYKAQEYLGKIQIKLLKLNESLHELQINSAQPITHLFNSGGRMRLDSGEEQDSKRRCIESVNGGANRNRLSGS